MINPCHASIEKIAKDPQAPQLLRNFHPVRNISYSPTRRIGEAYKQCEAIFDDLTLLGAGRS